MNIELIARDDKSFESQSVDCMNESEANVLIKSLRSCF